MISMIQFTNDYPDFWIQLRGQNAGKPLRKKIPNSIGVKTDPAILVPDFLFYTLEYLYSSGAFQPYISGSVLPFISHRNILAVLSNKNLLSAGYGSLSVKIEPRPCSLVQQNWSADRRMFLWISFFVKPGLKIFQSVFLSHYRQ